LEGERDLQDGGRVNPGQHVVGHDAPSGWERFQAADGKRFDDVESPEKEEAGGQPSPRRRNEKIGEPLPADFVDDDRPGVLPSELPRVSSGGPDTDEKERGDRTDLDGPGGLRKNELEG
jgi:hypothetical protein